MSLFTLFLLSVIAILISTVLFLSNAFGKFILALAQMRDKPTTKDKIFTALTWALLVGGVLGVIASGVMFVLKHIQIV